jgi:hypothetical protein
MRGVRPNKNEAGMSTNPYKVSEAPLELQEAELSVPEKIRQRINCGWIAGLMTSAVTTVIILFSFTGTSVLGIDAWSLIDVALICALSYGVFRKSRICAVLLLAFFALSKAVMWIKSGSATGLPIALAFLWFFFRGVMGTFQFHRWKRESEGSENA